MGSVAARPFAAHLWWKNARRKGQRRAMAAGLDTWLALQGYGTGALFVRIRARGTD